ncbi:MAG: aldehyde dehydrogenase family protein [Pseudomonadota bacterium]
MSPHAQFLEQPHQLWINGQWVAAQSGAQLPVIDPATGEQVGQIADAGAADIDAAVAAARASFDSGSWRNLTPQERARAIHRFADALEAHAEELTWLESLDNGKPIMYSRVSDVPASVGALRYYAGWADKINGATVNMSMPGEYHAYTLREPVGVAALVVPWNFPLVMAAMKLGPALAAGCSVVLKPAEDTSLTALRIAELSAEAGLPAGLLNVVTGRGATAGAALAAHPDVDKVAFTGSTATGQAIINAASGNLKKVTLELGGKAPNIILPDADLAKAIPGSAMGIFFNSGQVCTAASRLYVHESCFNEVIDGIVEVASSFVLGPGREESTTMGPVVSARQQQRVLGYIDKGTAEGADIACGGKALDRPGYFIEPTVMTNTNNAMTVVREEIFGPVLVAQRFREPEEVLALANDSDYGLSAVVWTENLSHGHRFARQLRAGNVGINTAASADWDLPIGGFKKSGWGRENGPDGLNNYLETKAVVAALAS